MHEAAIAEGILEQALIAARGAAGTVRISEVEVELGDLQGVVAEALELAFRICAEGTPAEGATLQLRQQPAWARCRLCSREFAPDVSQYNFSCPNCQAADVLILRGRDIILCSVVCEASEGDR